MYEHDVRHEHYKTRHLTHHCKRLLHKDTDGPWLFRRFDTSKKMVRYTFALGYRYLVGDDGQTLVHLHGISIDNFAGEAQG